ncbi:hypothetical protein ANN_00234 [Periplaneta americana]|uniref:C2H2-type domain-containing protein n=1 Tax=Periplaneta americana TaxID=6978 RepID=A0ABQ8TQ73_PERAM|nr:hypothetical protein ANN_00234 [Periplaneta americana]
MRIREGAKRNISAQHIGPADYVQPMDNSSGNEQLQFFGNSFIPTGDLKNPESNDIQFKSLLCNYCGKSFIGKEAFLKHTLTHKEDKLYMCEMCGRNFEEKRFLASHMLSHSADKPFKCDTCEMACKTRSNLMRHKLTHTGDKANKSQICEKLSSQKHNLVATEGPYRCVIFPTTFNASIPVILCQLPHKGKGVCTFEECSKANFWISSKKCLSSSEYINAIKMSCNVTAVRSVPGRTFSTTRCCHPSCSETETLGHVLGFCKKGELLRNNRHHLARTAIANLLRNRGWKVHEEIHCVSEDDSRRRVDIIAINRRTQKAMVLDPKICFERDTNQALQINDDKRAKYVPCLPYLSEKYGISPYNWDVTGLLFGNSCGSLESVQLVGQMMEVSEQKGLPVVVKYKSVVRANEDLEKILEHIKTLKKIGGGGGGGGGGSSSSSSNSNSSSSSISSSSSSSSLPDRV